MYSARWISPRLWSLSWRLFAVVLLSSVTSTVDAQGQLDKSRKLQVLEFNNKAGDFSLEQSEEEVVRCEFSLVADFNMGLIAEAGLLLTEAVQLVMRLREYAILLLPGLSSQYTGNDPELNPKGLDSLNTFRFLYAILPPKGGSADISRMLRFASESAILAKFKELVLSSPSMREVTVSDDWLMIMPLPQVTLEMVRRPVQFETWTSTREPPPYIPRITTSEALWDPQDCGAMRSPCMCASLENCEWVTFEDQYRCQEGRGRVPCTACDVQEECQAQTCGGLSTACQCAFSRLQCHWDSIAARCLEGLGTTRCSACARQAHCSPPEIVSFVPASGVQLAMPIHRYLQIDFDRTVTIKETGTVSFSCSGQPLPFFVPYSDILPSLSRTGIRVSISTLLDAQFTTTRLCTLEVGYGVVVDNADVPFIGLERDQYVFLLGDTVEPSIIGYEPGNGQNGAPVGGTVIFSFNEEIQLLSGDHVIILYEVSQDSTSVGDGAVAEFPMSSPNVAIFENKVSVDLSQFTKGNLQYSVDLPSQAVSDVSGNIFQGLPAGHYTFRTVNSQLISVAGRGTGLEQYYPLMMAGAGGLFLLLAAIAFWRFCRLNKVQRKASSIKPEQMPPTLSLDKEYFDGSGTFGSTWSFGNEELEASTSGKNWAQKVRSPQSPQAQWQQAFVKSSVARKGMAGAGSAAATLGRSKPSTPSGPTPTIGEFQSKSFSKRSERSASGNLPTRNSQGQQGQGSNASNNQSQSQSSKHSSHQSQSSQSSQSQSRPSTSPAPAKTEDFGGDSVALKNKKTAIEKKLRDLMDKPIAERKKALREMMLEYHPDKSSDEHAKEVFQFINAARSWFLLET